MPDASLSADYFDKLYACSDDPWNFASSEYERAKYEDTLAMLGGPYERGLEIGCSIGVLTAKLAASFGALLAVDVSRRALHLARARCASLANVRFRLARVPAEFPQGPFNAIVLSEVGYYWSDEDLALVRDRIVAAAPGGCLELVHFLPPVDEYVRSGDAVHEAFIADPRFTVVRRLRRDAYRIDSLHVA